MSDYGISYATRGRDLDTTFAEITNPSEILVQDIGAALDEAEGSFFWAPEISIEVSRWRNEGITPARLSEVEARIQGVLGASELISRARATASFDPIERVLYVDCEVTGITGIQLELRLVVSETGFEIVRL